MSQILRKPTIFAKFLDKEILGEQGRLLYSLLSAFATAGYPIRLFDNVASDDAGKYGLMARSLPGIALTRCDPERTADLIYLHDREDRALDRRAWHRKIRVAFDIFSPYWFGRPLLMPYPVHPVHAGSGLCERLLEYRDGAKKVRVFFAGTMTGYTRNRIQYPQAKLPRLEIVNTLLQSLGGDVMFVQDEEALAKLFTGEYVRKCVILDTSKLWVSDRIWLSALAKADFFLALPGITMPMSHNAVESMAVGTIPVTNYPEWFRPGLRHLHDCIAFDHHADLVEKLRAILAMDAGKIAALREHVIAYYENHLSTGSFIAKIESSPDARIVVLMVTEAYVAKNASGLNGRSVLLRGTEETGARRWLRGFMRDRVAD